MKITALFFTLFILLFLPNLLTATDVINTEDHPEGTISMYELVPNIAPTWSELKSLKKQEQKLQRAERRFERIQKLFNSERSKKKFGIFSDPVNRWFWIWIMGWSAGLLLLLLSGGAIASTGIGIIWFSLFVIGSVSLVIWLVKKFG